MYVSKIFKILACNFQQQELRQDILDFNNNFTGQSVYTMHILCALRFFTAQAIVGFHILASCAWLVEGAASISHAKPVKNCSNLALLDPPQPLPHSMLRSSLLLFFSRAVGWQLPSLTLGRWRRRTRILIMAIGDIKMFTKHKLKIYVSWFGWCAQNCRTTISDQVISHQTFLNLSVTFTVVIWRKLELLCGVLLYKSIFKDFLVRN